MQDRAATIPDDTSPPRNDRVYIHELVDISGPNRAKYMHHITANWSPIGQAERGQLCFGIWGTVGSTGRWPEVVNLWEYVDWAAMAANFEHEFEHPTLQDPSLADWWNEAASFRSGGFDRLLVAAPWSPTIGDLLARGVRGVAYAHEIIKVTQRGALELLDLVRTDAISAYAEFGVTLVGAFETAMCNEAECLLLWAFPTWASWGDFEAAQRSNAAVLAWRDRTRGLVLDWQRTLLVDAPFSPMRIGRQPEVGDRAHRPEVNATTGDPLADTPERAELRSTVRRLVADVSPPDRTRALDEAEQFDDDLHGALAEIGALAIGAPGDLGGAGDVRDQLVVVEELAAGPTSMAAFLIAQYAVTGVLTAFGTTDEHRRILDDLLGGRTKVAFSMSEPSGGTDVARAMQTRAARVDGGWRINGQKMWTSGATLAEHLVVLARTAAIDTSPVRGVTMFLVPTAAPGVTIRAIDTFGIHGMSTCEVFYDDVFVDDDAVLGAVDAGMRQVFTTINREGLNAAAACIGVGRGALDLAVQYALDRQVFGKPIGAFQTPQHWLVDGAVSLESARSLMVRAAEIEVAGGSADTLASMAKLVASEAAERIALKGMQLMGGAGYSREYAMQRFFRDGRLWSFSPLTNEMVRNRLGEQLLGLPRSY